MSTQLIALTKTKALIAGPKKTIFKLPEPHNVAIQGTMDLDWPHGYYILSNYLKRWSENLPVAPTVFNYAFQLVEFMVHNRSEDEASTSDEIISACRTFLARDEFAKVLTQETYNSFVTFEQMEERSELDDYDYLAFSDQVDLEKVKAELAKSEPSKPLDVVEDAVLLPVLEKAVSEISTFHQVDLGEELIQLIKDHGTKMLRWYRNNFEVLQEFTVMGFGGDEQGPAAVRVEFGGSFGSHPIVRFSNPFSEQSLQDSTYQTKDFEESQEALEFLDRLLIHELEQDPEDVSASFAELFHLKTATYRFINPQFSPLRTMVLELTKSEVVKE